MSTPEPVLVRTLSVPVADGLFTIADATLADPRAVGEGLDEAVGSGHFVGVVRGVVTVVTPAPESTGTPITVEVWARSPGVEGPDQSWDHDVELDLDLPSGRLVVAITTDPGDVVDGLDPGGYRLRVSGQGFTPFEDYDGGCQESYRLRLWPRRRPTPPVLLHRWPGWADF